ncbi:arginase family protein [Desulfovibrio sp. JC022]|uniref:arginase family protein n=1 Tax=Desulfovibrio sp. JC022 TaxID=2593642 RepID=UPI0013D8B174|nr:arginase family protein [Desulfovibrio sp. JC022]NDV23156.1 arginase family protein [Desulfovibrio sp. JC022]
MKDITLVFPQWQGSIDNEALYEGAFALADGIPGLPSPRTVDTAPFRKIKSGPPIAGRDDIIRQLQNTCALLEQENPDRTLLLGGDCGTETGPVSWMSRKHGDKLALIWFDAHPDLITPKTTQSGRFQGMALSAILGNAGPEINGAMFTPLHPTQVFCAGARTFDPPELDFIVNSKMSFFGPGELERDPAWLAKQIEETGFSKVYIHMDVDAVNPIGFAHGKPSPPAGLHFSNVLKIITEVGNRMDICGLGITEFHPGSERGIEKAAMLIEKTLPGFLVK